MGIRMKRTQILFPEEEYARLQQEAVARSCSVGQLVREAVKQTYHQRPKRARQQAARRLVAMQLPVNNWPQVEEEISQGMRHD